jgi:heat-inducible transcriptional repressor
VDAGRENSRVELTERQAEVLRSVVEAHVSLGQPVGSKWLAENYEMPWGPSTIRAELARLEELGLLQHPHTSAGRVPTDHGYRQYADALLATGGTELEKPVVQLPAVRAEVDEAMRTTTEQLSQVTNLLAIVSAPPLGTTTIKHVEVLLLQPQVAMVVVITSTGGVTKRVVSYEQPLDPGLVNWAPSYLNEVLGGMAVGARMLHSKLNSPELSDAERDFLSTFEPAFSELDESAEDNLYVGGAARLMSEDRLQELSQINGLMKVLERRVVLLSMLRSALEESRVYLRIGAENEAPELRAWTVVAANYGIPRRNLGTVSVVGPTRMDYPTAIASVRQAAAELSRFVGDLYDE